MSGIINAFNNYMANLVGSDTLGSPKEIVDMTLRDSQYDTGCTCLICGNTAQYKIVPKKEHLNTAQIQDKGFVCNYCLSVGFLDRKLYGIREMK